VECGNHYARSMASWGVLVALSGLSWDGRSRSLRLAPHAAATEGGAARLFISTAAGWGEVVLGPEAAELRLLWGELDLAEAEVVHPDGARFTLEQPVRLAAGERVSLMPADGDHV
jgi:non-lysosomal glucosylceramidase